MPMMRLDRKTRIRLNFSRLIRETNIHTLLPELIRRNVVTNETLPEYIKSDGDNNLRRLYLHLGRLDWDPYDVLMDSLRVTGHGHLVDILEATVVTEAAMAATSGGRSSTPAPSTQAQVPAPPPPRRPSHAVPFVLPTVVVDDLGRDLQRTLSLPFRIDPNTEPLVVTVKPAERFFDNIQLPVYKARSKNRGIALVINNINFDRDGTRNGATVDGHNVRELFRQSGVKVKYYQDLKADHMRQVVREHALDENLYTCDVAFFVFMSHGGEDVYKQSTLKGTDGQMVKENWIVSQFNNRNCSGLLHKPKIFIFQMCRGENLDYRTQTDGVPTRPYRAPTAAINFSIADNTISDVLIAHSTLPGFQSHRDVFEGSWYISILCKVFMEDACVSDVEMLLKKVQDQLKGMISANMTSQTSTYLNVGFKYCFLHPGIYEENGVLKRFQI